MIEVTSMRWKLMGFGFGEYFCEIAIFLRDFRGSILSFSGDSRQVFREGDDRIEMEDIDLIVGSDFAS